MAQSILTKKISEKLTKKDILICSHAVLGFPDLAANEDAIKAFARADVDIIELQFPYSDPMADGPILLAANQSAVRSGTTIDQCFALSKKVVNQNKETLFLIMTYYNIVHSRGHQTFAKEAFDAGITGIIIPDLPIEEAKPWCEALQKHEIAPIFMVTPDTSDERMAMICRLARGFIYCVARKGITGEQSTFGPEFQSYIARVKNHTNLPTGTGFGVRSKQDVAKLKGVCDIAIVCSRAIDILEHKGIEAAALFLKNLR